VEGYWKKVKQGSEFDNENTKEKYVKETVAEIQKYPIADPKERNIPKWVCEKYGVRMAVSESDGKTPNKDFVAIMKKLVEKQQTADQIASNLQGEAYKRASSLAIRSIINKNGEFSENPETFRKANLLKNFGILKEGRN